MRLGAVGLVVLGAVLAALLLGGGGEPADTPRAVAAAASAPVEPCDAGRVPTAAEAEAAWAETGPAVVVGLKGLRRARPGRVDLRLLVVPGVPVRVELDGVVQAERRLASCAAVSPVDRPRPTVGHRLVTLPLDLPRRGCARLTAAVEGGAVATRWIGLGRRCAGRPAGGTVAACHQRVEPPPPMQAAGVVRAGSLQVLPTGAEKFPVGVRAGAVVTLRTSAPLATGGSRRAVRTVTYIGCPADEPLFSAPQGVVGEATGFAGAFARGTRGCVAIEARERGRAPVRVRLPIGVPSCP